MGFEEDVQAALTVILGGLSTRVDVGSWDSDEDYASFVRQSTPLTPPPAKNKARRVPMVPQSINVRLAGDIENKKISDLPNHAALADNDWIIVETQAGELKRAQVGFAMSDLIAKKVWDYLHTSTLVTNSFGKLIKDYLDTTISSRAAPADLANLDIAVSSRASAADMATALGYIDTEILDILTVVNNLPDGGLLSNLDATISSRATPAQVTAAAQAAKLAADGLDAISALEPSGVPNTFVTKLLWLVHRFIKAKMTKLTDTTGTVKVLKADETAATTQTYSDDGVDQETGPLT